MTIKNSKQEDKMVPAEVVRDLCAGSFEHLASRIDAALVENKTAFLGESDATIKSVATFPDYVVAASSDGKFFRANYTETNGVMSVSLIEEMSVPTIDKRTSSKYVRGYAMSVVDSLLAGTLDESIEMMHGLLAVKQAYPARSEQALVEGILSSVQSERPWRRLYASNADRIRTTLGDTMQAIEDRRTETRFVKIYDGSISQDRLENFRDEVTSDLNLLADRLEVTHTLAEASYYPLADALAQMDLEEGTVMATFSEFSEDLINDIREIRENVAESLEDASVLGLAQIHDAVAETSFDLEVASRFVAELSSRLMDAKHVD